MLPFLYVSFALKEIKQIIYNSFEILYNEVWKVFVFVNVELVFEFNLVFKHYVLAIASFAG